MGGNSSSSNEVTGVFESKKHGLWRLTNGGLFIYDYKTGRIERLGSDKDKGDVLMSHDINSFYEDNAGLVWIGTWQGGFSRMNVETGEIITYKISDGLPSMCIQGILPDEKNNALWLSTFEGISRFSMRCGTSCTSVMRSLTNWHKRLDPRWMKRSESRLTKISKDC